MNQYRGEDQTRAERILQLKERHAQLMHPYIYHLNAVDTWGLEVLKTLFLLGAAGIAGVFTLAQAGNVGGTPISPADLPFLSFALATIAAVLSLLAGRFMHEAQSEAWRKTVNKFSDTGDMSLSEATETALSTFCHVLTFALGIVSAAASVFACWSLYSTFFLSPP